MMYLSDQKDIDETKQTKKDIIVERISYMTRALVKNNIVKKNAYCIMLALEYLIKLYYILRISDKISFDKTFHSFEKFLIVEQSNNNISEENTLASQNQRTHIIINATLTVIYLTFACLFIKSLFKLKTFDQTYEQSYFYKSMATFMVLTLTVFQMPVIINIMIVIKTLSFGISGSLMIVAAISNIFLIIIFFFILIYSLKFLNLEVPNDEIPWSHNQTGGIFFKVIFKIFLASQELYRQNLDTYIVQIILLLVVLGFEALILLYRVNTPNIFNPIVHNCTLFLESLLFSLTIIGFISLITERDIMTTLAFCFLFIPILIKIVYWLDEKRKHYIMFKLKSEDPLSRNEYLIALTHLLKMIKRQSETDLAQLLSFSYYHKIQCYDEGCICQFLTQYCQNPEKFKKKVL